MAKFHVLMLVAAAVMAAVVPSAMANTKIEQASPIVPFLQSNAETTSKNPSYDHQTQTYTAQFEPAYADSKVLFH